MLLLGNTLDATELNLTFGEHLADCDMFADMPIHEISINGHPLCPRAENVWRVHAHRLAMPAGETPSWQRPSVLRRLLGRGDGLWFSDRQVDRLVDVPKWSERLRRMARSHAAGAGPESRRQVRAYARAVMSLFDALPISHVLVSSNSVPQTGILYDIGQVQGCHVATYERGAIPGSFHIDAYGAGPFSTFSTSSADQSSGNLHSPYYFPDPASASSVEATLRQLQCGTRRPSDDCWDRDRRAVAEASNAARTIKVLFFAGRRCEFFELSDRSR